MDKYMMNRASFTEVMGLGYVRKMSYSGAFTNIRKAIRYQYIDYDGYADDGYIDVWELMAKCKEYLLNKNINILTDINPNKNNEELWTAIAVNRKKNMSNYFCLDMSTDVLWETTADTEYEAVFKITDTAIEVGKQNMKSDNHVAMMYPMFAMEQMPEERLNFFKGELR